MKFRLPWSRTGKLAARVAAQPRDEFNRFTAPQREAAAPAQAQREIVKAQADTVQETGRMVQNTGNVIDGVVAMVERFEGMVDKRVEARMAALEPDALDAAEEAYQSQEPGMLEVAMELMPQILPRIDAAIQAFSKPKAVADSHAAVGYEWQGLSPAPILPPAVSLPTSSPSPPAAPTPQPTVQAVAGDNLVGYIKQLAAADKKTIKLIAPVIQGKLTQGLAAAGITREELLAACEKMPTVLRAKPAKPAKPAEDDEIEEGQLTLLEVKYEPG